jgi:hypothetical protein
VKATRDERRERRATAAPEHPPFSWFKPSKAAKVDFHHINGLSRGARVLLSAIGSLWAAAGIRRYDEVGFVHSDVAREYAAIEELDRARAGLGWFTGARLG